LAIPKKAVAIICKDRIRAERMDTHMLSELIKKWIWRRGRPELCRKDATMVQMLHTN
jgi:hypothetical protein